MIPNLSGSSILQHRICCLKRTSASRGCIHLIWLEHSVRSHFPFDLEQHTCGKMIMTHPYFIYPKLGFQLHVTAVFVATLVLLDGASGSVRTQFISPCSIVIGVQICPREFHHQCKPRLMRGKISTFPNHI